MITVLGQIFVFQPVTSRVDRIIETVQRRIPLFLKILSALIPNCICLQIESLARKKKTCSALL